MIQKIQPVSVRPYELIKGMADIGKRMSLLSVGIVYYLHRVSIQIECHIGLVTVHHVPRGVNDQIMVCHRHIAVARLKRCIDIVLLPVDPHLFLKRPVCSEPRDIDAGLAILRTDTACCIEISVRRLIQAASPAGPGKTDSLNALLCAVRGNTAIHQKQLFPGNRVDK